MNIVCMHKYEYSFRWPNTLDAVHYSIHHIDKQTEKYA